jgi:hypothetical protein
MSGRRIKRGSLTISAIIFASLNFSSASFSARNAGDFVDSASRGAMPSDLNSARNSSVVNLSLKKSRFSYAILFSASHACASRQVDQVGRR